MIHVIHLEYYHRRGVPWKRLFWCIVICSYKYKHTYMCFFIVHIECTCPSIPSSRHELQSMPVCVHTFPHTRVLDARLSFILLLTCCLLVCPQPPHLLSSAYAQGNLIAVLKGTCHCHVTHPWLLATVCLWLYRQGINSSFLTRLYVWKCVAKVFSFDIWSLLRNAARSGRRFGVNSGSSRLARLHWLNLSCFQYYP